MIPLIPDHSYISNRVSRFKVLIVSNLALCAEMPSCIDPNDLAKLYDSSLPEQHALWPQLSSTHPTANQAVNMKGCNCTRCHVYTNCRRLIDHLLTWFGEEGIKNDSCTCPPIAEGLLALECPKLAQHVQVFPYIQCELRTDCHLQGEHRLVPLDSTICSCPNAEHYISIRCSLYSQHLKRALKGKGPSHPENPLGCSCAKPFVLVSRSCMTCINYIWQLEVCPFQNTPQTYCYMVLIGRRWIKCTNPAGRVKVGTSNRLSPTHR